MPSSSASSLPCSVEMTCLVSGEASSPSHLLVGPVALVADEDLVDTLAGMLLDVGVPCADVCAVSERSACLGALLNDRSSVTSYTSRMPMAPR